MIDNEYVRKQVEADFYPQGEEMRSQIAARRRTGLIWRYGFLLALVLAVIILTVLLLTIVNQSFGLVAEQTAIPESALVRDFNKERVVNATNVALTSEDDQELAAAIAADPSGVGFFGYPFYDRNRDQLNALAIDGVEPSAETAISGEYPAVRPLFLYTSAEIVEAKPEVEAFLLYYLQNLGEVVPEVGFFPAEEEALLAQAAQLSAALGAETLPEIDPADYEGTINIAGSSTVFPVTEAMVERFVAAGFKGEVQVESTGTGAGFQGFCVDEVDIDIVDASRPASQMESEACRANDRPLQAFQIATDAVVAVVSAENTFADAVTQLQLEQMFTDAVNWSDVNPEWPELEITRYVPSIDSGTMDFFVQTAFVEQTLADLPYEQLVAVYTANVTRGRCRAVEREQRFYADQYVCDDPELYQQACVSDNPPTGCALPPRTAANVRQLVEAEVIQPRVLQSWYLFPSIFNREQIVLEASENHPNAELRFQSWISREFITSPQSSEPEIAGVRTAILGSLWVVLIAIMVGLPLGVAAAVYLEEYASQDKWYNRIIQTNINNLAGVPSIIYGILGLAVFVRALEPITSGAIFGAVEAGTTANGRTILSAGLTLGLLGLPIVIIAAQESIRAVPQSLRQASMGLGATKWQTIWNHVLPNALPGILTGTILTMSRVIGETAPLVVVGASTFITSDPTGPFSKFTALPVQVYQWTTRPQDTFRNIAGAAIIVLLILLLMLNATAIILRNRFSRRFA